MKPIATNVLSVFGYIGLIILFNLPYVGLPALLICALFIQNQSVRSFARAIIIIEVVCTLLLVVVALLGFISFSDILEDFYFDFSGDEGTAFLNSVRYYLGA